MKTHDMTSKLILFCLMAILLGSLSTWAAEAALHSATDKAQSTAGNDIYLPLVLTKKDGSVYYLSPQGNDSNSGLSKAEAWATLDRAWHDLYPGDTLLLMDGIYHQSLNPNVRNGEHGRPITVRAENDGRAIIDGDNERIPVKLGNTWPGPIGNYFIIEGIIARNSSSYVIQIDGAHHNVLRRVSAYNANPDTNSAVIGIISGSAEFNLVEDCIAGGSGRKMIMVYEGVNNTIRRCFAHWERWEGREFCGVTWPFGDGIQLYSGDYNIVENSIVDGLLPSWAVSIQANDPGLTAIGNSILGTMAIRTAMNPDDTVKEWGQTRPAPSSCPALLTDFENWPGWRSAFMLYGQGELRDNLMQDIFAWGNAGLGISAVPGAEFHPNNRNNRVDHATIVGNGIDQPCTGAYPCQGGGDDTDALARELHQFDVTNSNIKRIFISWPTYPNGARNLTSMIGDGACLTHCYVDGVLMDGSNGQPAQPLWPWPMEDRIQAELGISVTEMMTVIISGMTH